MKCPQCSHESREDAKFCSECGYSFVDPSSTAPLNANPDDAAKTAEEESEAIDKEQRDSILAEVPAVIQVPILEPKPLVAPSKNEAHDALPHAAYEQDLSGFERLVSADYIRPEAQNIRVGDTAELPAITDEYVEKARSYRLAPDPKEERKRQKAQKKLDRKMAKERAKAESSQGVEQASQAKEPESSLIEELRHDSLPAAAAAVAVESTAAGAPEVAEPVAEPSAAEATEHTTSEASPEPEPAPEPAVSAEASRDIEEMPAAPSSHTAPAETAAEAARKQSHPGRIIGIIVALLIVLGAAAAVTYFMEIWGGVSVPQVVGLSQDEAVQQVEEAGFTAEVIPVPSDDNQGTVLSTQPSGSDRAELGTAIELNVASPRVIPNVKGKTKEEAQKLLDQQGFQNVTFKDKKSNKKTDTVLSVEPKAGTEAKAAKKVVVTVAIPFTVPDVTGKVESEAVKELEAEGYKVNVEQFRTEEHENGTAVSTDPKAGTELKSGSEVTLKVARTRGADLVDLTMSILPGATLYMGDGTYEVVNVKSVSYVGDGEVAYTVVGRKFQVVDLPFDNGSQTFYDNASAVIEGSITWNKSDEVSYAEPSIRY